MFIQILEDVSCLKWTVTNKKVVEILVPYLT